MSEAERKEVKQQQINGTAFRVLVALSMVHCMNDALQSVLSASYPIIKNDMGLSFSQIGYITLTYQMSASVFQPLIGMLFDRKPSAWSLPIGMTCTLVGLLSLAFSETLLWMLVSVFLIGLGSSTFHPEASRLTSLSSGGKRGLAQSIFQVGGNLGSSLGPLMVAAIIAPHARSNIAYFTLLALLALLFMYPICRWYSGCLKRSSMESRVNSNQEGLPYSMRITVLTISILLVLIFSKYVYLASLTNYFTFYVIEKFGVSIQRSQIYLFIFLVSTAIGTMTGGPIGDRIGRKYVIWLSILGTAPFSLALPYANMLWTSVLVFLAGFMLSSAFPAILVYAQELLPFKLGMVSGLFFGFAFGIAGISAAVLGRQADIHGIETVYKYCSYMPLIGSVAVFLPNMKRKKQK
jgi:FSR family fosmidomycin resistance protein-like MFS transporter